MSQIISGAIPWLEHTPEGTKPYVESVSFHLPLHRVLASFLREALPLFGDDKSNNNNNNNNNYNNTSGGIEGLISQLSQLGTGVTSKQIAGYTLYPLFSSYSFLFPLSSFFVSLVLYVFLNQQRYHPLRIAAMNAQIRAGLWRAGGGEEEVWGQSVMYTSVHFQKYFDLDTFLIQVCSN